MTVHEYIAHINQLYITGNAREHSYRSDLQVLITSMLPDVLVTNEPARVSCGAPDYMLTRKNIPVGYIEAKDIGVDLNHKNLKEQFDRYKAGLSNLIITDYLQFRFYKDGEFITDIRIAEVDSGIIKPIPDNFTQFTHLIKDFTTTVSQSIKSPSRLAKMMAGKARLMADVIEKSLNSDDNSNTRSNLKSQMISFKQMLIHDITNKSFSDIYAQTIAYGMFAARYHDPTLETFSRTEAAQLIPKSNPFLRKLFQDIAGYDLDDRLVWIVDELVNIFLASDVSKIMKNFGKSTGQDDPVIHFYETFLAEYNPNLRKSRGVWYTPQPVVNFIVRAVDDILKTEFNLTQGLADTSKTKISIKVPTHDKRSKTGFTNFEQEVHKVQILDPATGTSTFLAEVVRHIYKGFQGQQGIWSNYVKKDLIPRLNGFELLMASYAMAHLKMDMLLTETGYKPTDDQRLRIYLTNSLEEAHPDTSTLFSSWLSDEADQANAVKRDTPVMCVIGNPPYSVSSSNKSDWIESLVSDYKKGLDEKNIQPLSDDYIKFIRFGEHLIEKNGEGVLAYITNNSFIDGLIHRQMRKHLLETFDDIYILDLHGSSKRKEKAPDGGKDENVFDILSGVSINIFIKKGEKKNKDLAKLKLYDLFGERKRKYEFLENNQLDTIKWKEIYSFNEQFSLREHQISPLNEANSFKVDDLFLLSASGITTERDHLTIQFDDTFFNKMKDDIIKLDDNQFRQLYSLGKDGRDWKLKTAREDIINNKPIHTKVLYRPFDIRNTLYSGKSKGFHSYPRATVMDNFINTNNIGLVIGRQGQAIGNDEWNIIYITDKIIDSNIFYRGRGTVFSLYLNGSHRLGDEKKLNLNLDIVQEFADSINHKFLPNEDMTRDLEPGNKRIFQPIDLMDYIYAVLYSPDFRKKYKDFLKIDFPRIPYPKEGESFWKLVEFGSELRQYHLLNHSQINKFITQYPIDGNNIIERKITKTSPGYVPINDTLGKVWINNEQYFDNVPLQSWVYSVGGYQPLQKWLKDRKGRDLSYDEVLHYQRMIVALNRSIELMEAIDEIGVEPEIEEMKIG
ncbi:N-6 DNA methylase [Salegentibacter sp. LM13S]|uniref:type ISP restriction/modification enzyme n=1 Tax=Salegentibacter lacus TaxID=2873599 RepID=UPI001CCF732E|nr:type ISP restriction/modification enzyme [Salegentibacter lacus]MBZ9632543.1 N-6 DNA methylase [Salegentibacter lacus]